MYNYVFNLEFNDGSVIRSRDKFIDKHRKSMIPQSRPIQDASL